MTKCENWQNWPIWQWFVKAALWLVAAGLMITSTCFDGVYLENLSILTGFGFALNVFADIANPAMMYWYGRLQQDRSKVKQRKSESILTWERIAIGYSWLFSWRQLRGRVYLIETAPLAAKLHGTELASVIEIELLAFAFAGFVPLMLAGIGALQALIAGRIENEPTAEQAPAETEPIEQPVSFPCPHCSEVFPSQQAVNGHQRAHRTNGHKQPMGVLEIE
jgi:hypothetical protein